MHLSKNYKLLLLLMISCLLVTVIISSLFNTTQWKPLQQKSAAGNETPLILWWTPILNDYHTERQCGFQKCIFSVHRELQKKAKVMLFYGSDMNKTDLPLPRLDAQLWGLLHEESPKNVPFIAHEVLLRHFNFSATFSRYSDFPLTTQYLKDIWQLTSTKFMLPVGEKTRLRQEQKLAPIVFLQSICDTMSGRDIYVEELMKHIDVDSYGKCLNNKDLPDSLRENYLNSLDSSALYHFLARYKFIISYENGICNDYISEKFWRPLIIGSVPIYFGAPTIRDWQPNNKSVIYINDFPHPQALAAFLKKLDANDREYNNYLRHKYSQKQAITNKLLESTLIERYASDADNIFDHFECFICQRLHQMQHNEVHQATRRHYDCPQPLVYPPMRAETLQLLRAKDWNSIAAVGKCQARILDLLLRRNIKYSPQEFEDMLNQEIRSNKCSLLL